MPGIRDNIPARIRDYEALRRDALSMRYQAESLIRDVVNFAVCEDCGVNAARYFAGEVVLEHGTGIPTRCGVCDVLNNDGRGVLGGGA